MSISSGKCVSCEGSIKKLSAKAASDLRKKHIKEWKIIEGSTKLFREFKFKDFKQALKFVNDIGRIAEKEQHHPDISFGWGYVKVYLQTHAIGGLHENDFIIAAKIDELK